MRVCDLPQDVREPCALHRPSNKALAEGATSQFIQVRPRTTTKRVPSLTALLSRCVSAQSMILVPPLLTCMAGTHSHAWQSCRARYGRAAMAVRALNSLHGSCGTGPFMHLRVRLVARIGGAERR